MKAIILADKYSKETVNKIISYYASYDIKEIIICVSSTTEEISEENKNDIIITYAKLKEKNNLKQLLNLENLIEEDRFFLTFGENLCETDLNNMLYFHKKEGKMITVCAIKENSYLKNGGIMIFDTDVFGCITEKMSKIEKDLIARVIEEDEVSFYISDVVPSSIYSKKEIYQNI